MPHKCQPCAGMSIERLISLAWAYDTAMPISPWSGPYHYRHHESLNGLEASATSGCDFCQLVLESLKGTVIASGTHQEGPGFGRPVISHWAGKQAESNQPTMYSWAQARRPSNVKVRIWSQQWPTNSAISSLRNALVFDVIYVQVGDSHSEDEDSCPELILELSMARGSSLSRGRTRLGSFELDPDLGSQINFEIARSWLSECRHNHAHFSTSFERYLPTRVLDVGTRPSDRIRLYLCSQNEKGDYVALSHCWGGVISPLLTSTTLHSFQMGLPCSELPPNFQDAVRITRELGMRYLWIDSLCILQDSKPDWERECKNMYSVYRNSCVTIYALVAPGSKAGILNIDRSPPPDPPPAKLRISDDPTETRAVTVLREDSSRPELLSELLNNSVFHDRAGALSTRGWTLQEMTMSPQQLYYGRKQIYWRCFNGCKSADGYLPGDDPIRFGRRSYFEILRILNWNVLQSRVVLRPPHTSVTLHYFYRLVIAYSRRRLSHRSDKLPAMSGIAQALQPLLGGDYLAGIWSTDFRRGLLWRRSGEESRHQDVPYRSPSWSWAVTDDEIMFPGNWSVPEPFPETDVEMQLQGHSTVPRSNGNVYGELQTASITLKGHTKRFFRSTQVIEGIDRHSLAGSVGTCFFDELTHEASIRDANNPVFRATTSDGEEYLRSVVGDHLERELTAGNGKLVDYHEIFESVGQSFDAEECLALIVHTNEDEKEFYCLILQVEHDIQYQVYRRVGVLWGIGEGLDMAWFKSWKTESLVIL